MITKPFKFRASNGIRTSLQSKNLAGDGFPKDKKVLAQEGSLGAFSHASQMASIARRGTWFVTKGTT